VITEPVCLWPKGPLEPRILSGQMHIWCASLHLPEPTVNHQFHILSSDEQYRAEQFRFDQDRRRFIVGRLFLRTVLSRYISTQPNELVFGYGEYGKPFLALPSVSAHQLHFNLAHSSDLAVCAIASGVEPGIDLELIRRVPDIENIAKQFFSEREWQSLLALEGELQVQAFYRCWTCKEAFIKALGKDFSHPSGQFAVSVRSDEPVRLRWVAEQPDEANQWWFSMFIPVQRYIGAVAIRRKEIKVEYWSL
jgi:4'-phosphopantetheinyl transferase